MSISDWKGESSLCVQGEIDNFFPIYMKMESSLLWSAGMVGISLSQ